MALLEAALRILLNRVYKQGFAHRYHYCGIHAAESVSASCGTVASQAGLFYQTRVALGLCLQLHDKCKRASEGVKWWPITTPGHGQGLLMGAGSQSSMHLLFLILPVQLQPAQSSLR